MLDALLDQGAGLRIQTPQAATRLAALVAQGDADTELPLLWQLCAALQALGYQVAVLDGTSAEHLHSPGLLQLLDGSIGADDDFDPASAPCGLSVFPAALGLRAMADEHNLRAEDALRLARLLRPHDIVLLYAPAEVVAHWAADCAIAPVLPAAPLQSGVLAAYRSLRTLHAAGIAPTVASVVTRTGMATAASAQAARENLARCAEAWLGLQIEVLRVRAVPPESGLPAASGDVHRLALRLIEGAATLAAHALPFPAPATGAHYAAERFVRSH